MSTQHHYPTDLSDQQWEIIAPLLPPAKQWEVGYDRPPCNRRLRVSGILKVKKVIQSFGNPNNIEFL